MHSRLLVSLRQHDYSRSSQLTPRLQKGLPVWVPHGGMVPILLRQRLAQRCASSVGSGTACGAGSGLLLPSLHPRPPVECGQ